MKRNRQAGIISLELIVAIIFLVVVIAAGIITWRRIANHKAPSAAVQQKTMQVPVAPQVQTTSDLTKAQQTLDQTNVDAASGDSSQLDSQLNGL